jgi:hypothetical protein
VVYYGIHLVPEEDKLVDDKQSLIRSSEGLHSILTAIWKFPSLCHLFAAREF